MAHLRLQLPPPEPCVTFSVTRLSPGQSIGRIPPRHRRWRPAPATGEAPRPLGLGRCRRHPARGPSLRRVLLSRRSSLPLWPPPTSARRSTTSRDLRLEASPLPAPQAGNLGPHA